MQVGQDSTRKPQHEDLRRRILKITQDLTNTKESVPLRVIVEVCMRVLHVEEHVLLAEILHLIKEGQLQRISVIFSKKVQELLTASAHQGNSSVLLDFVLLDPQRRNVYHAIQRAGGIIFSDLQAETNLGPNHLNLYLNQLCNLKLVNYFLMGRSRVFHLSSLDPKQAIVAHRRRRIRCAHFRLLRA